MPHTVRAAICLHRVRIGIALAAIAASACSLLADSSGLSGDEPPTSQLDASVESEASAPDADNADAQPIDTGTSNDAMPPEASCGDDQPFGPAIELVVLDSPSKEGQPRLSFDEKTIYFQRQTPSQGFELYAAKRSTDGGFDPPDILPNVNSSADDISPSVTKDGLYLYFASNRDDAGAFAIYVATRNSTQDDFGDASPVLLVDGGSLGVIATPFATPDRAAIYYATPAAADGGPRVVRASLTNGKIANTQVIDELGTAYAPAVSADDLAIYFSNPSAPTEAMYVATRSSPDAAFGGVAPLSGGAASTASDRPGFISADRCRFYFARNVSSDTNLFVAERH